MGMPPASGECYTILAKILSVIEEIIIIKDDILIHIKGDVHDANLDTCLARLHEYSIRLQKENCNFSQKAFMWFGHIYLQQSMTTDPVEVKHIQGMEGSQR